jgi:hypothetical protein
MASPYPIGSTRHPGMAFPRSRDCPTAVFSFQREHKKILVPSQFENIQSMDL